MMAAHYGYFREYRPEGRVWLDRLLIDRHFQGNGYGTEALRMLLGRLSGEYGCSRIYLSIIEENETAAKLYEKFGLNVVYYRKQKKLTQLQLAELVDIDRSHISAIELGNVGVSFDVIFKLCEVLEITPKELFDFR